MSKKEEQPGVNPAPEQTDILDELNELGDTAGGVVVSGRVYRMENPDQQGPGRTIAVFVGCVDSLVDEDYIGRHFGGGVFKLRYRIKTTDRGTVSKDFIYRVDSSYNKYLEPEQAPQARAAAAPVQQAAPAASGLLDGLLNNLTAEKITAFGFALKAIKELFRPDTPAAPAQQAAPDYMELIKILAANQSKQSVSDAILIKAMDGLGQANKQPSIIQQFKEFRELKEALKEETENQDGGENMNMIIEAALKYLPALLQKNNNNFQKVGEEARQMPIVQNLIANDPNLATQFISAANKKYGPQAARQLAAGFGYNMQVLPTQAPAPAAPFEDEQADSAAEYSEEQDEENEGGANG